MYIDIIKTVSASESGSNFMVNPWKPYEKSPSWLGSTNFCMSKLWTLETPSHRRLSPLLGLFEWRHASCVFVVCCKEVEQKTNFRYDGAETSNDHIYHLSCIFSSFITSGLWQLRVLVAGFGGIDLVSWDLHTKRWCGWSSAVKKTHQKDTTSAMLKFLSQKFELNDIV